MLMVQHEFTEKGSPYIEDRPCNTLETPLDLFIFRKRKRVPA